MSGVQAARVAADLRKTLGVEVSLVNGQYGEFSVHVDGVEVFNGGPLVILGVVPTRRRVREIVQDYLARRQADASST